MFGTTATTMIFISATQVQCALLANNYPITLLVTVPVSVTNDGTLVSNSNMAFNWFDSVCHSCNSTLCIQNPTACVIGGFFYASGSLNPVNPCQTCEPAKTLTAWTYSYSNGVVCGPSFDVVQYFAPVLDTMPLNSPVMTAHTGNVHVDVDAATTITYSLPVGSNTMFQINANTGVVTTSAEVSAASINPQTFNSPVVLVVTDSLWQFQLS